jgi:hypothetical protein
VDIARAEATEKELDALVRRRHDRRVESEGNGRQRRCGRYPRGAMLREGARSTVPHGAPSTRTRPPATAPSSRGLSATTMRRRRSTDQRRTDTNHEEDVRAND